ncbi:MAG: hypothetical protein ABIT38_09285 [Gemmatimonadaceae bacterium]
MLHLRADAPLEGDETTDALGHASAPPPKHSNNEVQGKAAQFKILVVTRP